MSHLLRCGLVAAGLVIAFAAGFYLKPVPAIPTVAAQPPTRPPLAPPIDDPEVKPATALGQPRPVLPEPSDPLDAAGMAMIRKEMGIKTTVLDKSEPVPAVLADAQKTTTVEPSTPMGGPMPRLEPPPAAPVIDHAPIRRPDLPPGTLMRITIRDPAGTVTTVMTSGQVTMELVAPDGPRPGPDTGPTPREVGATPIPEPLRSVLPILLGSPSIFPPLVTSLKPPATGHARGDDPCQLRTGVIGGWQEALPEEPAPSARAWVERLTNTTVVEVGPVAGFVRRDPVTVPPISELLPPEAEWVLAIIGCPIPVYNPDDTEVWYETAACTFTGCGQQWMRTELERFRRHDRTLLARQRNQRAVEVRDGLTGGRSVLRLFIDPDWKPTTATPASCRWEYEPAPTSFWGTPPLGIRFDF